VDGYVTWCYPTPRSARKNVVKIGTVVADQSARSDFRRQSWWPSIDHVSGAGSCSGSARWKGKDEMENHGQPVRSRHKLVRESIEDDDEAIGSEQGRRIHGELRQFRYD